MPLCPRSSEKSDTPKKRPKKSRPNWNTGKNRDIKDIPVMILVSRRKAGIVTIVTMKNRDCFKTSLNSFFNIVSSDKSLHYFGEVDVNKYIVKG